MADLRPVDLPQDYDIATPEEYKQAILRVKDEIDRPKLDKIIAVLGAWARLPRFSGTTEDIGKPVQLSPGEVHLIVADFGGRIAKQLAAINGYRHGVHPNGEAFPWSTTGFARKRESIKGDPPWEWVMRRNFLEGLRLLNGWLPKGVESGPSSDRRT
jgi:hypothetical protein